MDWRAAKMALLADTPADPREAGNVPDSGLYAWWDLTGSLAKFWPANFHPVDTTQPLYVGDAPSGLGTRIQDMHLKTTRYSGLRRSLAALLVHELDLLPGTTSVGRGKVVLDELREAVITDWMIKNLELTWVLTNNSTALEKLIIADLCPPLNYKYATNSVYRKAMWRARKDLCAAAAVAS